MAASPIFHGAIAKISVVLPGQSAKIIGIFTSVTYSVNYATHVAHTLGKHKPQAITYTAQEAIRMSLTGFRTIGASPFKVGTMPELKALMTFPGITVTIQDRSAADPSKSKVTQVEEFFPTDFSTGVNARSVSDITVTGIGITYNDDATDGAEGPNAVNSLTEGT